MSSDAKMPGQWQSVQLGDLVDSGVLLTQNGFAQGGFNEDGFGVPHMRPFNISEAGEVTLSQIKSVEPPPSTSQCWLRAGDVLFNNTNSEDLVGKTAYWSLDGQYTLSNHMTLIRSLAPETVDTHWLARLLHYLWQTKTFKSLCRRYVGQASISLEKLRSVRLPLPPIDEQRAIARILRAVQAAREARQREVSLERERKAALMAHLFTHGTRGEPTKQTPMGEIPKSWGVTTIGDIAEFLQYGTSRECSTEPIGVPVLRIPNIISGKIDTDDLKYLELQEDEADRLRLAVGDIIFVRTNGRREYTGRCAVFMGEPEEASFASYMIRARLKPDTLMPQFAQFYATTPRGSSYLAGRAANAADGKFNINTRTINSVLVPQPSLDEQSEIVAVISACDAKIDALERESALLDELFRALLEELMTGRVAVAGVLDHETAKNREAREARLAARHSEPRS